MTKPHKRVTWGWTADAQNRIINNQCPVCGKSKNEWGRRTDWATCSKECSTELDKNKEKYLIDWQDIRRKVIKRDNDKCVKCGAYMSEFFVVDHILPVAIGGSQTDLNNLQLLCSKCNKIKTKHDMHTITAYRKGNLSKITNVTILENYFKEAI